MKTADYIKTLETGEIGERFADYESGYICDVISEIADAEISIYTGEQVEFALNERDWTREALWSGIAMNGKDYFDYHKNADFYDYAAHVGIAAWYEKNCSDLYEHMTENVRLSICTALKDSGIEDLTDEQIEEIEFLDFDNNDRLEDVIAEAFRIFENDEDEDENEEDAE